MEKPEATKEHRWLQKLVGEWTSEMTASMGPDKPEEKIRGVDTVRSIGDVWVVAEGRNVMPGGEADVTVMTLGYDPQKQRFVGTFIASMMTWMWVYEGTLDAEGRVLTLNSEGPSFTTEGAMGQYRDVIEFVNDDHRILRSFTPDAEGEWKAFMTMHYHRKR